MECYANDAVKPVFGDWMALTHHNLEQARRDLQGLKDTVRHELQTLQNLHQVFGQDLQ